MRWWPSPGSSPSPPSWPEGRRGRTRAIGTAVRRPPPCRQPRRRRRRRRVDRQRGSAAPSVVIQAGRARADRRPDRPVPGLAARAGVHGLDLPARNRPGGTVGEAEPDPEGFGRCPEQAHLGPERQVADQLPPGADHDEREARLDRQARRRVHRGSEDRHGRGPAAAQQGVRQRKPQDDQRANGEGRAGDRSDDAGYRSGCSPGPGPGLRPRRRHRRGRLPRR